MTEIFSDVSDRFKKQVNFLIDRALQQKSVYDTIKMIKEFSDTCVNESEKDFIDFSLKLKILQQNGEIEDEDNSDQR